MSKSVYIVIEYEIHPDGYVRATIELDELAMYVSKYNVRSIHMALDTTP